MSPVARPWLNHATTVLGGLAVAWIAYRVSLVALGTLGAFGNWMSPAAHFGAGVAAGAFCTWRSPAHWLRLSAAVCLLLIAWFVGAYLVATNPTFSWLPARTSRPWLTALALFGATVAGAPAGRLLFKSK